MDKKKLRSADLLTSIICIIIGLIFTIVSIKLILSSRIRDTRFYMSLGFVPLLLSISFISIFVNILRNAIKEGGSLSLFLPAKIIATIKRPEEIKALFVMSWIGIYIFVLMKFFPYTISTSIFLFVFISVFYPKKFIKVAIITICVSIAVTYMFGTVANVILP